MDTRARGVRKPIIGITSDIGQSHLKLKHGYCEAVITAGGLPVVLPPSDNAVKYADLIDGLMIPGGDDLEPFYYGEEMSSFTNPVSRRRSDFEFRLLTEVIRIRKPILGICYGMQLINVFHGGTLYQDLEGIHYGHREGRHAVLVKENRFVGGGRYVVNSTHHQGIKELGKSLVPLAFSDDNLIEAFQREGYNFLVGVQWHPERLMEHKESLLLFTSFIKTAHG